MPTGIAFILFIYYNYYYYYFYDKVPLSNDQASIKITSEQPAKDPWGCLNL